MKIIKFGTIEQDGALLKFSNFHFAPSYEDEPPTHAGVIKAVAEYMNLTITDSSFLPFILSDTPE